MFFRTSSKFNYWWWVHKGKDFLLKNSGISLRKLSGHAYDLGRWQLVCEECKATETMKDVPFASSEDNYGSKCNKFESLG